ncbi:hypothetical protein [Aeromonas aquatica]|uniref:hypothetical protein n=1 Tax=Aeromonas aquatica TaxID=558964 RepID=UPI00051AB462|nr:hypothetical protein [Aeromonas aquatica]
MTTIAVMCRDTGKELNGMESLRQRLTDCLSFQTGTLVGRRLYGADLLSILDRNMTPGFPMDVFVRVAAAVAEPENGLPDFRLDQVGITSAGPNWLELQVVGTWVPSGEPTTIEGVRIG